MNKHEVELFSHLPLEVVKDISGFKLCSYLVALEGWRRGLELKWYKDESPLCKLDRLNSSTQGKFFSLKSTERNHYFFRSRGDKVGNKDVRICQDKEITKDYLKKSGVPVPLGAVLNNKDEMIAFAQEVGFPVVVKPLKGSMGKGVYTNIDSVKELNDVLEELRISHSRSQLMIEKHYYGKEYRVYTVGEQVVGATNRIPANVVGDGVHSIQELIDNKNNARKSNPYLAPKPIKIDYEVKSLLKRLNYDENTIPKKDETVFLREKSNLSSGGDPIEATDELTPEVKQIAVEALKALPSIPHAGVDIIIDPNDNKKGIVLEINATAEIGFHLYPLEGKARDVPGAIIDYYFPETKGQKKTQAYFDYTSTIEPLKSWAAEELKVTKTPSTQMYVKKFLISGNVIKVGYMNFIKRQAHRNGFSGYSKRVGKNIEVVIYGENEVKLDKFIEICKRGSKKSRVDNVVEEKTAVISHPIKLGFQIV